MAKRYLTWMAAFFGIMLLPLFALNLQLASNTLGNNKKALLASQWQQATRGVTYAPTLLQTQPFKTLRLNDRLPNVNAVVFGSSTAMGITASMFPEQINIYNFSQSAHPLSAVPGEIFYILQNAPNIQWYIVPLDWSLGFIYNLPSNRIADLSLNTALQRSRTKTPQITLLERMRDALSYPRIKALFTILVDISRAENKGHSFAQYFLRESGDEYRCADGTPAKDFDTIYRGTCTGFRFDGSSTFANMTPLSDIKAKLRISSAILPNSKYATNIMRTKGVPNSQMLYVLGIEAKQVQERGSKLLLFMPPLLPGLERAFMEAPDLSMSLARTKQTLDAWARQNNVAVIDAGQSERYGCTANEFVDEHHALPECYAKIFSRYWGDDPDARLTGLYAPQ